MILYTVKRGDSLYSIARRYGTDVETLTRDNGLARPEALSVGEILVIPEPKSVYTVREGDTLYSVAQQFGVSVGELWRNNPFLGGGRTLPVGARLTVVGEEPLQDREISLNTYVYPSVDRVALRTILPYLTYLTVLGYGMEEDGTLIEPQNDGEIVELAREYGVAPILQIAGVGSDGAFSGALAAHVLSNEQTASTLLSEIETLLSEKRYRGVEMDLEGLPAEYGEVYAAWIDALRTRLAPSGRTVFVSLAPRNTETDADWYGGVQDVRRLGEVTDGATLSAYGWGYALGDPMAVSPLPEVREAVSYVGERMPPAQVMLGLSQYGYHWTLPFIEGESRARPIDHAESMALAREKRAAITYDETARAPYIRWFEREGGRAREHMAWFENAQSLTDRLALVEEYGLGGVSVWNGMRYTPWLWQQLAHAYPIRKIWE